MNDTIITTDTDVRDVPALHGYASKPRRYIYPRFTVWSTDEQSYVYLAFSRNECDGSSPPQ